MSQITVNSSTGRWFRFRLITAAFALQLSYLLGLLVVWGMSVGRGLGAPLTTYVFEAAMAGIPVVIVFALGWTPIAIRLEKRLGLAARTVLATVTFAFFFAIFVAVVEAMQRGDLYDAMTGIFGAVVGAWCGALTELLGAAIRRWRWLRWSGYVVVVLVFLGGVWRIVVVLTG